MEKCSHSYEVHVSTEELERIKAGYSLLRRIRSGLRLIFGIPDYERYLDYWHASHSSGGENPLSKKDFFARALHDRYGSGKQTRCC
ncbi:CstA-like transporter-associated (seleno)protein [Aneurinibacillus terranovensis]|uniref:CstA-like transporter-associated (seleno)protein n=1 Tax=Aneurinibacillus terranovensis TaxID=278991 RepID=UPI000685D0D5|nr:YbdD/YjiX family protein [Aneurinibacillus terranovensis]